MTGSTLLLAGLLAAAPIGAPARAGPLRAGDYLEDRFLAILRETGSPLAAFDARALAGVAQMVRITPAGPGLRVAVVWNWHEGTDLYVVRPDGTLDRPADIPAGDSRTAFGATEADTDAHLVLHMNRTASENSFTPTLGYTHVGDADRAIARIALAGRYDDHNGRTVVFGDDNVVHGLDLPGVSAESPYTTVTDHVFDRYDYVLLGPPPGHEVAFRRMGETVVLYPVLPPPHDGAAQSGVPDYEHPLIVLTELR